MATTPEPLPSLPPSPGPSPKPSAQPSGEDIARVWHDDEPLDPRARRSSRGGRSSRSRKGKERATSSESDSDDDDSAVASGYPPTKEEEAESRRIAENLRRWEIAERQRRKAARESASIAPSNAAPSSPTTSKATPSLLADLLRRDSRKAPLGGVGTHQALSTTDRDAVPLDDLDPNAERSYSPGPPTPTPETENPFETPMASRTSLNVPAHSAIMSESDTLPEDLASVSGDGKRAAAPQQPTLEASSSFAGPGASPQGEKGRGKKSKTMPPPPQPLGLPPPREPPGPDGTVPQSTDRPPEPVPPPSTRPANGEGEQETTTRGVEAEERAPPTRWWHEWLCGCGEGPDRGGDNQAGRTNPFE